MAGPLTLYCLHVERGRKLQGLDGLPSKRIQFAGSIAFLVVEAPFCIFTTTTSRTISTRAPKAPPTAMPTMAPTLRPSSESAFAGGADGDGGGA